MPLTACLFELAVSHLIAMGVNQNRRMWFIIDELASLGRLNGFSSLMSEGRKYGGCVLAAMQSITQLFENFGQYGASHIFGQFATKFLFRTDDPISAKIIADIFGQLEYSHQQKNTSFGANEFRDGISYTEQQRHKPLITTDALASLADHQCFVGLPEPLVRIAKIKVPVAFNIQEKHQAFIARSVMIDPPQQRAAESDDSNIEQEPTIDQPIDSVLDDHQLTTDQQELDPILTKQAIF
jgi:hypothetical protein